ncbi:MAG: hypothetical protein KMY53_03420 [Desulfarculus sp.]|nr:hypothetical protein [Pseudomonadota bacterium]MBU4599768.1 hypothetical protein [Pseudomonadota bacterium]MBV1716186.1 hypothetical protein [Desulfarculus sp.]MBV1737190.1 hypothetical protein [Desulfarculus sp.]
MSHPSTINREAAKVQAKRLRAFLAEKGMNLSHSLCLEAIAATYGIKDWNTMAAMTDHKEKLYVANCFAEMKPGENGEANSGYFQYFLRAESLDEVLDICKRELAKIPTKGSLFHAGDKLSVESIIELEDIPSTGVLLNLEVMQGDHSSIGSLLPLAASAEVATAYDVDPGEDGGCPTPTPRLLS